MLARWSGIGLNTIGLDREYVQRGAIVGLIGLGLVALAFGTALTVPALRAAFYDGGVGAPGLRELLWLALVRIPLGTIALEEVAFRGVLPALFGGGQRWRWPAVLGAATLFGLWHALSSLALRQNAMVQATFGSRRFPWSRCSRCSPRLVPASCSTGGNTLVVACSLPR
jgi:membrane protease YdiL (CAAX protease family)